MYCLIASATPFEIANTREVIGHSANANGHELETLVTGIGGTMTAYSLTSQISRRRPDFIIQAGIGGSFTEKLPPVSAALVQEEVFADLGAAEREGFADFFDLNLADARQHPFTDRWLVNPDADKWTSLQLPLVKSASVNAISSTPAQAQAIRAKYNPSIESMEGAALHFVCLMESIPFLQLRTVSNYAGERNKANWKMKEAIAALNYELNRIITAWCNSN